MIGYYGHPQRKLIDSCKREYGSELIDLDVDYNHKDAGLVPKVYCQIIRNIINNALFYKNKISLIIASVGEEKCDAGRFAGFILKDLGFNVIESRIIDNMESRETVISESGLPLKEKILRIMDMVHTEANRDVSSCEPVMGFWGVPPSDLSILELFPDKTHVFGWTRCVEAGRPADINLEMYAFENLPTVFFAQSFCQKSSLARYLSEKYNGLYVDADRYASESTKAKIKAFIKLRVENGDLCRG